LADRIADFLFLCTMIGVIAVIFWSVKSDKLSDDEKTTGLLAMKHPHDADKDG